MTIGPGVLLTAIILAGRTASAFTAQIGTMVAREEVDAIRTLGMDPIDLLVIPRVLALLVMLPLLRLWSVSRVHGYVTPADFVRGRYDSPLLALAIAITGIVATDLDPQGDPPEENPDLAPLAVDGDEVGVAETLDPYFGGVSALSWLGGGADPRRSGHVEPAGRVGCGPG